MLVKLVTQIPNNPTVYARKN